MNNFLPQKRGMQVVWIIVGCLIYAVGLNVFIIPMNLYSGGAVGLAQLLSYGAGQIGIKEIAGLTCMVSFIYCSTFRFYLLHGLKSERHFL